jgi:hypothetical protein
VLYMVCQGLHVSLIHEALPREPGSAGVAASGWGPACCDAQAPRQLKQNMAGPQHLFWWTCLQQQQPLLMASMLCEHVPKFVLCASPRA